MRLRASVICFCASVFVGTSAAQQKLDFCQREIVEAGARHRLDKHTRYQPRGNPVDRCEGLYGELHAGKTALLSVLRTCRDSNALPSDLPARMELQWAPAEPQSDVRIRVRSFGNNPYLLDARSPGPAGRFSWPADVLAALHQTRFSLDALASTYVDGTELTIPLSWTDTARRECEPVYRVHVTGVSRSQKATVHVSPRDRPADPVVSEVAGNYVGPRGWVPLRFDSFRFGDGPYTVRLEFNAQTKMTFVLLHATEAR